MNIKTTSIAFPWIKMRSKLHKPLRLDFSYIPNVLPVCLHHLLVDYTLRLLPHEHWWGVYDDSLAIGQSPKMPNRGITQPPKSQQNPQHSKSCLPVSIIRLLLGCVQKEGRCQTLSEVSPIFPTRLQLNPCPFTVWTYLPREPDKGEKRIS